MLVALIALLVGSFVYTAVADHIRAGEQQSQLQCITDYTSTNYARQSFLQRYASPRNDTQVAYEIAKAQGAPEQRIERLRASFIAAARAYNAAVKANPLPPPPRLACGLHPAVTKPSIAPVRPNPPNSPSASPAVPTPTARPRTSPTTRSGHTPSTTGTGPPPHTRTRTVTRTAPPRPPASTSRGMVPQLLCGDLHLPLCPTETP